MFKENKSTDRTPWYFEYLIVPIIVLTAIILIVWFITGSELILSLVSLPFFFLVLYYSLWNIYITGFGLSNTGINKIDITSALLTKVNSLFYTLGIGFLTVLNFDTFTQFQVLKQIDRIFSVYPFSLIPLICFVIPVAIELIFRYNAEYKISDGRIEFGVLLIPLSLRKKLTQNEKQNA